MTTGRLDSHANIRIITSGEPLKSAAGAVILLHGRGTPAYSMIELAARFVPLSFAVFAPQATESSWYPHRFIRPNAENEPKLSSAIQAVGRVVSQIISGGMPAQRIIIGGFSQGACLALEYAARHPQRFGGVLAFSGGLIGDENEPLPLPHEGQPLAGTPIFIGTYRHDAQIPIARVRESAELLTVMGGRVNLQVYDGSEHTINDDEITHAQGVLSSIEPL